MKKSIYLPILLLSLIIASSACSSAEVEEQNQTDAKEGVITITKSQFAEEQMQFGEIEQHTFEEVVKTNGRLVSPPAGKAVVNTHIPGLIKSIGISVGAYVNKGQALCSIEGTEVIQVQQAYKEGLARLNALTAEYERLKVLSKENIASKKEFIKAESEYLMAQANFEGLKSNLKLLKLDATKIEEGQISSSIQIKAPISGFISIQNCSLGQSVSPENPLMEIVDLNKLHLQFIVFEKDVQKLEKNQKLRFYSPENDQHIFEAKLSQIGKYINPETKTIDCLAQVNKADTDQFVSNMFAMVEIVYHSFQAKSLPQEALLQSEDQYYVLSMDKEDENNYYFHKVEVKPGMTQNGLTQIEISGDYKKVIINGVYNLVID